MDLIKDEEPGEISIEYFKYSEAWDRYEELSSDIEEISFRIKEIESEYRGIEDLIEEMRDLLRELIIKSDAIDGYIMRIHEGLVDDDEEDYYERKIDSLVEEHDSLLEAFRKIKEEITRETGIQIKEDYLMFGNNDFNEIYRKISEQEHKKINELEHKKLELKFERDAIYSKYQSQIIAMQKEKSANIKKEKTKDSLEPEK
ncbi:MAG: hypothetical protein IJS47_04785 [Clostridia bacterium]|nr:hypothetical protein [Clostridia bacterium]